MITKNSLCNIKQLETSIKSMKMKISYFTNFNIALDILMFLNISLKQFYKLYKTHSFPIRSVPSKL